MNPDDEPLTAMEAAPRDEMLQGAQQIMQVELAWQPPTAVEVDEIAAQRRAQVQAMFKGAATVDLIGHSSPIQNYLELGDWVLDPTEAARFASYLPDSVKTVRFIGCTTASDNGRVAIEAFSAEGRTAFGTANVVYTTHFDQRGVRRGLGGPPLVRVATGAVDRPIRPPKDQVATPYAPKGFRPSKRRLLRAVIAPIVKPVASFLATVRWAVIASFAGHLTHRRIRRLLGPIATPMPGLLTQPLLTYAITSGREEWRLEVLYDFGLARFYPISSSEARRDHVFKIRRGFRGLAKSLLEAYLERGQDHVVLLTRHREAGHRGAPAGVEPQGAAEAGIRGGPP